MKEGLFVPQAARGSPSDPWESPPHPSKPSVSWDAFPIPLGAGILHPAQLPWKGPRGKPQPTDTHAEPRQPKRVTLFYKHHLFSKLSLRIGHSCVHSSQVFISKLPCALWSSKAQSVDVDIVCFNDLLHHSNLFQMHSLARCHLASSLFEAMMRE